jgi:hypothetical protein
MLEIDRRGQDDPVRGEQSIRDAGMVVLAPAFALFKADGATDAVGDRLVGQKDLFQNNPLPGKALPDHPNHLARVADGAVG